MATLATLPPLRQDLALHPGAPAADGTPTWTLHDPAANRFYQLGWAAFEILSRWSMGAPQAVLQAVHDHTTLRPTPQDLQGLVEMLGRNHLLQATRGADTERLRQAAQASRPGPGMWLLKNYLFFRLPLVRPERLLQRLAPRIGWAFHPGFWWAVAAAALAGLLLASRRWDEFTHTFVSYASWEGAFAIGVAVSAAKLLHELGHALTAHRYGCRVPTMGVAFLVMWPVLYTDTNEAWKLPSRRQRLAIGAAGMLTELALGAVALLAWAMLPDTPQWGPARAGAFLLATTTWVLTLAINASPFMRFDGYFLLSDWINLPNLHERAFAHGRWWLRERLFGFGEPAPELLPPARQRFLIVFAYATWLYRLVLFLGIALLVYHLFFKVLGLVLMMVELAWFIALPVQREMKAWWQRRGRMRWNAATVRLVLVAGAAAAFVLWPWQSNVRAPAVLGALQTQGLYAPRAAQLLTPLPAAGTRVRAGQELVRLQAPELQAQLALAHAQEQQLRWQLTQQSFDARLREAGPALRKRWEQAAEAVQGLQREAERLTLVAPFDADVVDVNPDVSPAAWLPAGERLLTLVGPSGNKVDAYVDEHALQSLEGQPGRAVFLADLPGHPGVTCTGVGVHPVQLSQIEHAAVSSSFGGEIPSQRMPDGRLVPLRAVFRVRLTDCDLPGVSQQERTGIAVLQGTDRSWMEWAIRRVAALWQREVGF
ncbi:HlyD family efflux transporter periplasmic adaptor subunit [Schlegelella sp. S2-27]|uniref:HlyD family efflux transporter periplasmic adaptor subunit n=1 Tax=Caldimonas mangrovi TaxID=2944811 RepID=A0ABT0YNR5_9BURK|nr:HlyD family efflux transporter periplasmic adaptor subunit [Caldimonas mangrovi]MCM5679999.1 HlyD family efflux transporter periplasmic adaptor subunit [Caldimonas mangrovi]